MSRTRIRNKRKRDRSISETRRWRIGEGNRSREVLREEKKEKKM